MDKLPKPDLKSITSTRVLAIIDTIKRMQNRMKSRDLINEDFAIIYSTLSDEFPLFFDNNPEIFKLIVSKNKQNLQILTQILYCRDRVDNGFMTEGELSETLSNIYLPKNLKEESDKKIREIRAAEKQTN
jgi:hypothetical protein